MKKYLPLILILTLVLLGCSGKKANQGGRRGEAGTGVPTKSPDKPTESSAPVTTTADGIQIQDVVVGTGETAETGKIVTVNYTGWLTSGRKFDSSLNRGQPMTLKLGNGDVIKGWDEGLVGMKVGGKRKLSIPPALGYGEGGRGPIPPNSELIFEIDLLSVK